MDCEGRGPTSELCGVPAGQGLLSHALGSGSGRGLVGQDTMEHWQAGHGWVESVVLCGGTNSRKSSLQGLVSPCKNWVPKAETISKTRPRAIGLQTNPWS